MGQGKNPPQNLGANNASVPISRVVRVDDDTGGNVVMQEADACVDGFEVVDQVASEAEAIA